MKTYDLKTTLFGQSWSTLLIMHKCRASWRLSRDWHFHRHHQQQWQWSWWRLWWERWMMLLWTIQPNEASSEDPSSSSTPSHLKYILKEWVILLIFKHYITLQCNDAMQWCNAIKNLHKICFFSWEQRERDTYKIFIHQTKSINYTFLWTSIFRRSYCVKQNEMPTSIIFKRGTLHTFTLMRQRTMNIELENTYLPCCFSSTILFNTKGTVKANEYMTKRGVAPCWTNRKTSKFSPINPK